MFSKLALRNVTRSLKDYSVYFLTLTFGVSIFYVFNSLESQWCMQMLAKSAHYMVESILIFMNVFSAFVSVVLACLILYANTFLMKRRKRELGTYFLLGLPTARVSLLLFLETLLIGLAALVTGILLGILLSQCLGLLTIAMFSAYPSGEAFGLVLSGKAVGKTALYFGVIFLLVMVFTGLSVSRARLIDLMQSGRRNEEMRERPLWRSVLTFLAGVALLLAAYAMLLLRGLLYIDPLFFLMLALGTLGTLLVFKSLSGFVLRLVQSRPKLYFKNLNVFTLRQWISKVHSTYLAQTVICILLLLAMGITASSIGLNNTIESMTGRQAPFDITVQNQNADSQGTIDFPALLAQHGVEESDLAWQQDTIFYYNDPAVTGIEDASAAIRLSDCQALLSRSGQPAYRGPVPGYLTGVEEQLTTGNLGLSCVVVPDEMAQKLEVRRQVWSADYAGNEEETENRVQDALAAYQMENGWLRVETRLNLYQETMGNKILALFLGLYLGLTFLLAAAAVLALQQLSQAADNAGRYAILRRLGAEEKLVSHSAVEQVALAFLLPLGLALVHTVVGMKAANDLIAQAAKVDSVQSALVTALVLLLVYGGYFLATSLACRRLALDR